LDAYKEERFLEFQIENCVCPGCPNNCIKAIVPSGRAGAAPDYRSCGIHQEITGAMGPNLGIADLDTVLEANRRCNELGLDPTSLGFSISFAMECRERDIIDQERAAGASLRFGSGEDVLRCVDDIAYRRGLGDLLAEGVRRAAEAIGGDAPKLAMHAKGLEMVPFEPRSQTNLALGYAVAPFGPRYEVCEHDWDFDTDVGWDHTLRYSRTVGILERIPMGYLGADKVRNFKALLELWSAADALDFCIFAVAPTRILSLPAMSELLHAATGWETSSYEIMRFGARRIHLMRLYNLREGLGREEDRLPDRFYETPVAAGPQEGAVLDRGKFEESVSTFYEMMGWDEAGVPRAATLYDYGLEWARTR
jgi:aldehyde:ferredoxin oxidoreductase